MIPIAPTLFLGGNLLFKFATTGQAPVSHAIGLALVGLLVPPLASGVGAVWVLIVVAAVEHRLIRVTTGMACDLV